jgi:hypothetical protein
VCVWLLDKYFYIHIINRLIIIIIINCCTYNGCSC